MLAGTDPQDGAGGAGQHSRSIRLGSKRKDAHDERLYLLPPLGRWLLERDCENLQKCAARHMYGIGAASMLSAIPRNVHHPWQGMSMLEGSAALRCVCGHEIFCEVWSEGERIGTSIPALRHSFGSGGTYQNLVRRIPTGFEAMASFSHPLGRCAGFVSGCVRGANLVAEVTGGRLVDRPAPEVFTVPLHRSLLWLPIRRIAQHH
jgi:hypothetical protein